MTINLIKGDLSSLEECTESLQDSELGRNYFPDKEKTENALKEFIKDDHFLVAVDENQKAAGFICYLPEGAFHSFPYLHLLVTVKNLRGKGIGTMIMDTFEAMVFSQKDKLFLVVADFNPEGKRFYLKRNFIELGTIPSLYRPGINECLMMKTKAQ